MNKIYLIFLLSLCVFNLIFSQDNVKSEKNVIADLFGNINYEVDTLGKNEKNGFYKFVSLDSTLKISGNFRNNLKNGKFFQEIINAKKTVDGVYHQINSTSEGFYEFGRMTGSWKSNKTDVILSSKKDTNNYYLSILSNEGKDLTGELIINESAHCTFNNGKIIESFFYQINDISVSGYCDKLGVLDGKVVTDYSIKNIKMREIATYNKGFMSKLVIYIGDDKEQVVFDSTSFVQKFIDKLDSNLLTANINGILYKKVNQTIKYADKNTPLRLQALAFWSENTELSTTNGNIYCLDGNVNDKYFSSYLIEEVKSVDVKSEKVETSIVNFNNKLPKLISYADSLYNVKSFKEALENYSKAMLYNIDSIKDKTFETHLNNRIEELKAMFLCFQKIEEAKVKYDKKEFYEGLDLIKSCDKYDTSNLVLKFKNKIKEIEDSIQFEKYMIQISNDAQALEYRKAIETILKAKSLKQSQKLDSLEILYKKILDEWVKKNNDRHDLYKEIQDKYLSYLKKSDTLTLKLNEIKSYYHEKFDTCIGYLKHNEKDIIIKVKSYADYDSEKNEFKITDLWSEEDDLSIKDINLLKEKYDYHFTFIDKVEQAILKQDSGSLRNFKKYVYIKDIIMVFVKDL